jgi:hypothetical protein
MIDLSHVASQVLDPYARQARLAPALIVLLPAILLIMVWFPASWTLWGGIISVACSCGLVLLLSQIARDRGKQREPELYAAWGGKPSVALLRYRDDRISADTKSRYWSFLKPKLPTLQIPTPDEERADPKAADSAYESVTAWLLTQTRDTKKFSLLFRENISYGFRRNLWGLKPLGIAVSILGASASTSMILYQYTSAHTMPAPEIVIVTILSWLFAICWVAVVTPSWVRLPADAYGMQLLAACDTLNSSKVVKGSKAKA